MQLLIQNKKLQELMGYFYTLTGITLTFYDTDFKPILIAPPIYNNLCTYLWQNDLFHNICNKCNSEGMQKCSLSKKSETYTCHAGFTEVVMPIMKKEMIYGYMMFGQITSHENKDDFIENINKLCKQYNISTDIKEPLPEFKCKTNEEIVASTKILESLVEYIILKELLQLSEDKLLIKIKQFITANLDKNINVGMICKEFGIKRTKVYNFFKKHNDCSVAAYIKNAQFNKAKELLETTDLKISEISEMVGFNDYNYFRRVFRQKFGISPRQFRENI